MKIGIIGAGKLGTTLGRLLLQAGYEVLISGSGDPAKIELTVSVLLPGAVATTTSQAAQQGAIVILALPLSKYQELNKQDFAGKIVIDATNYWEPTDGPAEDFLTSGLTSSEQIQRYLAISEVVKALNHIGYHDLLDEARPAKDPLRKAIAIATDHSGTIQPVSSLISAIGFDPLPIGPLANGSLLQPGSPLFGADLTKTELKKLLKQQAAKMKLDLKFS